MSALTWMNRLKLDAVPNRDELDVPEYREINKDDQGFMPPSGEGAAEDDGPFEITPDLAQVRIVVNVGSIMERGVLSSTTIQWTNVVQSLQNRELRKTLQKLSPSQTLPASVKIVAATIGDSEAYRNMCHVKVYDHSKQKTMNTPQLYKGMVASGRCEEIGYPLHLLTDEGGFVLEEPPQLTDTFKHYWYISKSMLTCCAYKQESASGTHISIPKNSEAARLMYYVLVIKNGAMAPDDQNVTQLDNEKFNSAFRDKHDPNSWRFPEPTFKEVSKLLADKLQDVREKSFNCESITVEVACFDIFKELMKDKRIPALLTLEIDLHLPLMRDTLDSGAYEEPKHRRKDVRALADFDE